MINIHVWFIIASATGHDELLDFLSDTVVVQILMCQWGKLFVTDLAWDWRKGLVTLLISDDLCFGLCVNYLHTLY